LCTGLKLYLASPTQIVVENKQKQRNNSSTCELMGTLLTFEPVRDPSGSLKSVSYIKVPNKHENFKTLNTIRVGKVINLSNSINDH
jgi:hypothetical protein